MNKEWLVEQKSEYSMVLVQYLLRNAALAAFWALAATAPAAQTVPMAVPLLERELLEAAVAGGPELSPSSTARQVQYYCETG